MPESVFAYSHMEPGCNRHSPRIALQLFESFVETLGWAKSLAWFVYVRVRVCVCVCVRVWVCVLVAVRD